MKYEIIFIVGLLFSSTCGFLIGGMLASNKIQDAYFEGLKRGRGENK